MAGRQAATDRQARFDALYDTHADAVLGYAVRRVERPEDGADILAETMLVAWRRLDDVPPGVEARYWLLGVARRVLANHRRSFIRRQRLGDHLRHQLHRAPATDPFTQVDDAQLVAAAMDLLGHDDRELLRLSAWEGLGANEIALVWGVPATTVRTRLHRARARLREALQHDPPHGHWGHDETDVLHRNPEGER